MSIPWGPEGIKEWERIRSQPIPGSWREVWPPLVEPVGQKSEAWRNELRDPLGQWTQTPGGDLAQFDVTTTGTPSFKPTTSMRDVFAGRVAPDVTQGAGSSPPFTTDDLTGLSTYEGSTKSFDINKVLRGPQGIDSPEAKLFAGVIDDVHNIDSAMDHSGKIGKTVKVVRVTKSDPTAIVVGDKPGDPATVAGHSFVEKGYGSTTTDASWADQFADPDSPGTEWRLTVSPDVKAIWGANPSEEELLLQRDVRYTIHSVRLRSPNESGPKWIIEASVEPA